MAVGSMRLDTLHAPSDVSEGERFTVLGSLRAPVSAHCVERTRQFVRMVLTLSGGSKVAKEDAGVIVSELFTNVVLHVGDSTEPFAFLVFGQLGTTFRIEVHDSGELMRHPQKEPDLTTEYGRGLWIVHGLADRWGADETPDGKCVWAEIEAWPEPSAGTKA